MASELKDVADRLNVSRYTVYRWISKGRLKTIRIVGILKELKVAENRAYITQKSKEERQNDNRLGN